MGLLVINFFYFLFLFYFLILKNKMGGVASKTYATQQATDKVTGYDTATVQPFIKNTDSQFKALPAAYQGYTDKQLSGYDTATVQPFISSTNKGLADYGTAFNTYKTSTDSQFAALPSAYQGYTDKQLSGYDTATVQPFIKSTSDQFGNMSNAYKTYTDTGIKSYDTATVQPFISSTNTNFGKVNQGLADYGTAFNAYKTSADSQFAALPSAYQGYTDKQLSGYDTATVQPFISSTNTNFGKVNQGLADYGTAFNAYKTSADSQFAALPSAYQGYTDKQLSGYDTATVQPFIKSTTDQFGNMTNAYKTYTDTGINSYDTATVQPFISSTNTNFGKVNQGLADYGTAFNAYKTSTDSQFGALPNTYQAKGSYQTLQPDGSMNVSGVINLANDFKVNGKACFTDGTTTSCVTKGELDYLLSLQ